MNRTQKLALIMLPPIIGLLCYNFPFMAISLPAASLDCTGIELMIDFSFVIDHTIESDSKNWYLIASYVLAYVSIIFFYQVSKSNRKALYAGISSLGVSGLLLLFRNTFPAYYGVPASTLLYNGISLNFRFGWWLTFLGFLASGAGAIWMYQNPEV